MILKYIFIKDFEVEHRYIFWSWSLVKTLRQMFGWEMLTSSESSSYACNRDQNEFCPQKNILCSTLWSVFFIWVLLFTLKYTKCCSNTWNVAQIEQHCAYLNNISRIWATFCIEEDNLQKGNAFWGEKNYISVRKSGGRNIVGNIASETTFDHCKVVFSWGKMRKRALTF